MVAAALILLVTRFPTYWFAVPTMITLCRELTVSALREFMAARKMRTSVKVGQLGKLKTALQMVSTALLLSVSPEQAGIYAVKLGTFAVPKLWLFTLGLGLMYASTALAVCSVWQYLQAAWVAVNSSVKEVAVSAPMGGETK